MLITPNIALLSGKCKKLITVFYLVKNILFFKHFTTILDIILYKIIIELSIIKTTKMVSPSLTVVFVAKIFITGIVFGIIIENSNKNGIKK